MTNYKVGYGKPPKGTRFKPGKSGNPKGRPKYIPAPLAEIVQEVLGTRMQYRENGRTKTATGREVAFKLLAERAVKGDVRAADLLIEKRRHALRHKQSGPERLIVTDWLPDYPGQTADQKTREVRGPVGEPTQLSTKRKRGKRGPKRIQGKKPSRAKGQ